MPLSPSPPGQPSDERGTRRKNQRLAAILTVILGAAHLGYRHFVFETLNGASALQAAALTAAAIALIFLPPTRFATVTAAKGLALLGCYARLVFDALWVFPLIALAPVATVAAAAAVGYDLRDPVRRGWRRLFPARKNRPGRGQKPIGP